MTTAMRGPRHTLRLGAREFPVVLPNRRDPRLHLASVIISIHVLGQLGLGFEVSIAQILVAIVTCAIIEIAWTLRHRGEIVWPASAMLTGSGVALIFRVVGTEHGEYWSMRGWYLFALVAAFSVITKYYVRYRGTHVFNPSNVGLVVAFLILGSGRTEPLDFWWAPLGGWMIAAYVVIVVGGLTITARLGLLPMASAFWLTLAGTMGVLAASGHAITARWSLEPVAGGHFWWVIMTSPEILIFLFFMITDPKTIPAGRVGRVLFGAAVAITCTLLIAPQTTEFGAKVALLGGLVLLCLTTPIFDRFTPAPGTTEDNLGHFVKRLAAGAQAAPDGLRPVLLRSAVALLGIVLLAGAVVVAGEPARRPVREVVAVDLPTLDTIDTSFDPASIPDVTMSDEAADLSTELSGEGAQNLAISLMESLQIEAQALADGDRTLLEAVDYGDRLDEMQLLVDQAVESGTTTITSYRFDTMHLTVQFPYGEQGGPLAGLESRGSMEMVSYDGDGAEIGRNMSPCAITFTMVDAGDDRFLILEALPIA